MSQSLICSSYLQRKGSTSLVGPIKFIVMHDGDIGSTIIFINIFSSKTYKNCIKIC